MEPNEAMANLIPKKNPTQRHLQFLHSGQTTLISSMIDSFDGLALATNGNRRIVYANRAAEKLSGFRQSEILGSSLEKLFDFTAEQRASLAQCLGGKGPVSFETTVRAKTGAAIPVQLEAASLNPKAADEGMAVFAIDVSGLKHAIEEQARLVTAVEHAAESIIVTDPQGIIEYVNPAFEKITGYARNEVIGRHIELVDSGQHSKTFFNSILDTLQRGKVWQGRMVNKRRDHSLYETEATVSPVKNKAGEITNYVSVQRDVSHEVRLETQLRQAQKMEAIGTLAGGIAHVHERRVRGREFHKMGEV